MALGRKNCCCGSTEKYKSCRKLCNITLISLSLVLILLSYFKYSSLQTQFYFSRQDSKIGVTSKLENKVEHSKMNEIPPGLRQLSRKFTLDEIEEAYPDISENNEKDNRRSIYNNKSKRGKDKMSEDIEKIYRKGIFENENSLSQQKMTKNTDRSNRKSIFNNKNNTGLPNGKFTRNYFFNDPKISETSEKNMRDLNVDRKDYTWKKRLPQCIIIGMRKAGTNALITFLELNKNIKTANKEIHFFDKDENYNKGFDWYRKQMPFSYSNQITAEKTPRYVMEDKVPGRIFKMNSSIRLILIVKEPVLRAISEYAQNSARSKRYRKVTFEEYAINRDTGEVNVDYKPINRSIYYQHIPKWFSKFSRKQMHIVDGDNLVIEPFRELNKIETFLGLNHEITEKMFYFNRTKGFHCAKDDSNSEPVCLGVNKGRKHPKVSPDVIKKLQEFYRPWNEMFFKQVKQRFRWP